MKFTPNSQELIDLDGTKVYTYFFSYDKKKPTAIILHGLRADTQRIFSFIKILEEKYNVISFDLPGFGKSREIVPFSNYIEYCSEILDQFIKELDLDSSTLTLIGISHGANTIIDLLLKKQELSFKKIGLIAPIFSYKNLTMNPVYKRFVDWFTANLEKNGSFTRLMQKAFDNKTLFTGCMLLFDIECWKDKRIRDYEYVQWHLQTLQHWGATLKDFLEIDLSGIDQVIDAKNIVFAYPKSDQYLDVKASINGFSRIFPNAEFRYFDSEKHAPRGDFSEDEEFMAQIRKMVRVLEE